ncbi:MAG: hypothetical protein KJN64_14270 [Ignavibacteria bacterium]|nr:hypothetical protein [Ignavibacteria bacterium]MBT8382000.1 hypothetical protein [Ignavibacteria bacterium]MBT8390206.1 hypothetical protein [Ignavibacteria bacterium]
MAFRFNFFSLFVLLFFLFPALLTAQDYFEPNITDALRLSQTGNIFDARALGMGNAHSIINDTYSATLMNPATLGLARRFAINTSIGVNLYSNEATFLNKKFPSDKTETILNQAGLVIPLVSDSASNNFVISIGYNRSRDFNRVLKFSGFNSGNSSLIQDLTSVNSYLPRDLLLSYSAFDPNTNEYLGDRTIFNGNLDQNGYVLEEGGVNHWSFGIAYELASNIFFGASVNYNVGTFLSDGEFTEADQQKNYNDTLRTVPDNPLTAGFQSFYINDINDWVFNGVDFRFGVLYKFFDFIGIGGSVKTPTISIVDEKHYFRGTSEFISGNTASIDTVISRDYTVTSPFEFTLAAAVNIFFLTGTAEVTYIDYTQMKFSDGLNVPDRSALNKQILDTYTQTFNVKAGAEFRLPFTGLSARAGAMYIPYPVEDAPEEFDRKYVTAGLGLRSGEGAMEFNVTYVLGFWDQISEDYGSSVPEVYQEIRSDNIVATLTLRF